MTVSSTDISQPVTPTDTIAGLEHAYKNSADFDYLLSFEIPRNTLQSTPLTSSDTLNKERHDLDVALLKAQTMLNGIADEGNLTMKQAFQVLGVTTDADERQIKQAYRKAMLSVHTDTHQNAANPDELNLLTMAGTAVNVAYEILGKKERMPAPETSTNQTEETQSSNCYKNAKNNNQCEETSYHTSYSNNRPSDPDLRRSSHSSQTGEKATKWHRVAEWQRLEELLELKTFQELMAEAYGRVRGEHLKSILESSLYNANRSPEKSLEVLFSNRVESYLKFNSFADSGYYSIDRSATMQRLESTLDKIHVPQQLQKVLALLVDKGLLETKHALEYLEQRGNTPGERVTLAAGFLHELEKRKALDGYSQRPADNREQLFNELAGRAISRSLEFSEPLASIAEIKSTLESSGQIPDGMDTKYYIVDALSDATTGHIFMKKLRIFQSVYED